jgi:hypothetical protein
LPAAPATPIPDEPCEGIATPAAPALPGAIPPPVPAMNESTALGFMKPLLSPQPAARLKTDSVVIMPIELEMNSRRSMPSLRALSSQRRRISSRILRSRGV